MHTEAAYSVPSQQAIQAPAITGWWQRPRIVDAVANGGDHASHDVPANRTRLAVAAQWKGRAVGRATLDVQDKVSVIRKLYIDPAWRGRGVGRRLLRGLVLRARLHLVRDLYVLATAADAGFYALHGFRPVKEKSPTTPLIQASLRTPAWGDEASYILMGRHLSTGLLNVPSQGITVKL